MMEAMERVADPVEGHDHNVVGNSARPIRIPSRLRVIRGSSVVVRRRSPSPDAYFPLVPQATLERRARLLQVGVEFETLRPNLSPSSPSAPSR